MLAILYALGMFVADLFKSRSRLEAENLFLRHQLKRCDAVIRCHDTCGSVFFGSFIFPEDPRRTAMAWTTPVLVEICIGLEINGYLPADGYVPPEF